MPRKYARTKKAPNGRSLTENYNNLLDWKWISGTRFLNSSTGSRAAYTRTLQEIFLTWQPYAKLEKMKNCKSCS